MTTTNVKAPAKYKKRISDIEARLNEKNMQARHPNPEKFEFTLPELKISNIFQHEPREVVLYFMKKYRLVTLKDIGDFCGLTRQRIDVLMNKSRAGDFDFKLLQEEVKEYLFPPDVPRDPKPLDNEEWKELTEVDERELDGEYHVSNMGRVTIVAEKRIGKKVYPYRKLIMCKPDGNDRIRVGLKFKLNEEEEALFDVIEKERQEAKQNGTKLGRERSKEQPKKRDNFYVNKLVAQMYLKNPDPKEYTVISYKNGDFSDNRSSNLFWESKSDSLIRTRSPKVKGVSKGKKETAKA